MIYVPPEPPKIDDWDITETGLVSIFFNKDMKEIKDMSLIRGALSNRRLAIKDAPAFEFKVIVGADSDPLNIGYDWSVISMDKRALKLQLTFENTLYISREEEDEYLEIKINDGSLFLSEDFLPLNLESEG